MNKLVLILACAAALAVGIGAAFLLKGYLPTVLASVPNTRQILEYIQGGYEYIQQVAASIPPWLFGVLCTGATTIGTLAVNAWRNSHNREKETEQLLLNTKAEATAKIDTLTNQLEAKDRQLTGVTDLQAQLDAANLKVASIQTEKDKIQALYADASNQIGKVVSPSIPEMKRRLERAGLIVLEKAA